MNDVQRTSVVRVSRRRLATIATALLAVPFVVACGESDSDNASETAVIEVDVTPSGTAAALASPASATPQAQQILDAAADRLGQLESVRFELEIEGTTYIDDAETIRLLEAVGNLVRPDRVQATFQAQLNGQLNAEIRIITVGEETWMTDLITGDWIAAFEEIGYDPTILFDESVGLGPVMRQATDPEIVGQEEIDGRATDRIQSVVSQAVIGPITAETMTGETVEVDLWIDRVTSDLLRAVVVEQPNPENDDPATWTLRILRQNEPVTIEPPI